MEKKIKNKKGLKTLFNGAENGRLFQITPTSPHSYFTVYVYSEFYISPSSKSAYFSDDMALFFI